ncbi:MAG: hypothetical protein SGI73_17020 [Chloroflexota bacterium]|nr:hypothetical protein [Chloroflexota bacterium]
MCGANTGYIGVGSFNHATRASNIDTMKRVTLRGTGGFPLTDNCNSSAPRPTVSHVLQPRSAPFRIQ